MNTVEIFENNRYINTRGIMVCILEGAELIGPWYNSSNNTTSSSFSVWILAASCILILVISRQLATRFQALDNNDTSSLWFENKGLRKSFKNFRTNFLLTYYNIFTNLTNMYYIIFFFFCFFASIIFSLNCMNLAV